MNIYLTTGKKNYKYAYVAIKSLFEHNQDSEIYLYVVSEDLEMEDLKYELEMAAQYNHHILILRFNEEIASKYIYVPSDGHWPIGTMSSYWLFHELLPKEVDRIMVIESDTVTVGNLRNIYNTDFEGSYVISAGPEHKPQNHRDFMKKIGGECLTFVLSIFNVKKIKEDFTLEDILKVDEKIKIIAGNSQMEHTFGLLFAGNIKFIPGKISCVDENERYIEELGYDYITECEKTAGIIHFSSYSDYSKPWNPVFLVPGYHIWWNYALKSPYIKDYYERQWIIYNETREKQKRIAKNISYRNILLCTIALTVFFLCVGCMVYGTGIWGCVAVIGITLFAFLCSLFVRNILNIPWIMRLYNRKIH